MPNVLVQMIRKKIQCKLLHWIFSVWTACSCCFWGSSTWRFVSTLHGIFQDLSFRCLPGHTQLHVQLQLGKKKCLWCCSFRSNQTHLSLWNALRILNQHHSSIYREWFVVWRRRRSREGRDLVDFASCSELLSRCGTRSLISTAKCKHFPFLLRLKP